MGMYYTLLEMKFCVTWLILTGCLFFLLENGCSAEAPQENLIESEKLLVEISEKMNQWDKFFVNLNLLSSSKMTDDRDLQESMQICKSNQELIYSLLEKVNGGLPKDSLADLQQKLDSLSSKFEMNSKNGESNPAQASMMKNLERKLARLQYSLDRTLLRNSLVSRRSPEAEENSKLGLTQNMGEMFMDVAAKVDALYDKSTAESVFDNPKEVRHLGKGCKMLAVPYKKLLTSVDNLQRIVKEIEINDETAVKGGELRNSVAQDIRDSLENILEEIQILRRKNEKNINENERILRRIDKKLDSELEDDDEDDEKLKKTLKKYMIEQRRVLEKNLKKMLKDKDEDDNDDDDDDDSDDSDNEKRKNKSKKRKSKDDDDDNDDDDDDSDDDDKNVKKRKNNKNDTDDDDDSDDDDDDDDVKCDDSDENGSKSCEREKKKAYSRGKKKSKFYTADSDSDDDDDDKMPVKGNKKEKKYKVKKDIREIESIANHDGDDKLIADEPVQNGNLWSFLGVHPPDVPSKPNKTPDVTP